MLLKDQAQPGAQYLDEPQQVVLPVQVIDQDVLCVKQQYTELLCICTCKTGTLCCATPWLPPTNADLQCFGRMVVAITWREG